MLITKRNVTGPKRKKKRKRPLKRREESYPEEEEGEAELMLEQSCETQDVSTAQPQEESDNTEVTNKMKGPQLLIHGFGTSAENLYRTGTRPHRHDCLN